MILITKKPNVGPTVITVRGVTETANNNLLYAGNHVRYNSGLDKFKIKSSIYNSPTVKRVLRRAQDNKCCFCEKTQTDEYGAVEHFRPKGGYKAKRSDRLKKPGYYWYGYIWENLFFVCGPCNTKKGSIFPLRDETTRAKNHTMNLGVEVPLLLYPTGPIDPRIHITFTDQFVNWTSDEGRETIEICKLDRDGLNEERKKVINEIDERILILIGNNDVAAVLRAKNYLKNSIKPEAPFSAMANDYLSKQPIVIT